MKQHSPNFYNNTIEHKIYTGKDKISHHLICTPHGSGTRIKLFVNNKLVADKYSEMEIADMDYYLQEHVYCKFINMVDKNEFPRKHECPRYIALVHNHKYSELA